MTLLVTHGHLPTGPFKNIPSTDTHVALVSKPEFLQVTVNSANLKWHQKSYVFFFFKLYIIVLALPNIKMNPPQVYMCSPS